ncbi:hypothetical protein [Oricola sp.]|uniref:hypothetical protein n=1 Tax=Oricola sp. TaxID=1979950 RepID=UPI000C8BB14B|nr:hypothetical protein [Ahrensia sp.]MCK5745911.1 hypothetical protein [Oricola sp.]|tara:strand:+ start:4584 stop:4898 length:315 start_codon:yes stop_codon:yes gene_type:complete
MVASREKLLVAFLLAIWAGLFVWSFIGFSATEPTGDGFTRGFNRVSGFLLWQFAAGIVAVPTYMVGREQARGSALRWASRLPLALATALLLAIGGVIVWARLAG